MYQQFIDFFEMVFIFAAFPTYDQFLQSADTELFTKHNCTSNYIAELSSEILKDSEGTIFCKMNWTHYLIKHYLLFQRQSNRGGTGFSKLDDRFQPLHLLQVSGFTKLQSRLLVPPAKYETKKRNQAEYLQQELLPIYNRERLLIHHVVFPQHLAELRNKKILLILHLPQCTVNLHNSVSTLLCILYIQHLFRKFKRVVPAQIFKTEFVINIITA